MTSVINLVSERRTRKIAATGKLLLLSFILAVVAYAQPSCIQVSDVLYSIGIPNIQPMQGYIDLNLGYVANNGNFVVTQSLGRITVSNGVVNVCQTPGQYQALYSVQNSGNTTGYTHYTELWVLPASGGPYTVQQIRQSSPVPPPPAMLSLSQLSQSGASIGNCILWSGTAWIPSSSCGGGGTTPCVQIVPYNPTATFDFSKCTQQIVTLTGNISPAFINIGFCQVTGGCTVTFIQGSGAYTVTWAGNVHGGFQLGTVNGKLNTQSFTSYDGNNLSSITPGVINQ